MKTVFLLINHSYLFFGTSLYVGVLWALRFFWYPSWEVMNVANVQDHFIGPTSAATDFFTIVVPLMFLASVVHIYTERKQGRTLLLAIIAFSCISAATYVGTQLIIPVNEVIALDNSNQQELTALLNDWMRYNDYRFTLLTIMWLTMMYYFISKGSLKQALEQQDNSHS